MKLSDPEWVAALKRFLRKDEPWRIFIREFATVTVQAISKFKAVDFFYDGDVPIAEINHRFQEAFLSGEGKIEENVDETVFRIFRIVENTVDAPIIAELGGEQIIATTLGQVFAFLRKQHRGQYGVLLTNCEANIFYVRDDSGVL